MLNKYHLSFNLLFIFCVFGTQAQKQRPAAAMVLNKLEYLEYKGVNVMLAHDFYPEGHQGGVGIIQNGMRVATNGDIRLEPTPGQWQPIPKVGKRMIDTGKQQVSVHMQFPDSSINRKGFNPVIYPDLVFSYTTRVEPAGKAFRIIVDLDQPLPDNWIGKVGFNTELYPGILFGKSYYAGDQFGIFPQQPNGPMFKDAEGEVQVTPMASGKRLTIAPESESQRMIIDNEGPGSLQLLDGRGKHNNGWFVVRSMIAKGATKNAIVWLVTPHAIDGWKSQPVVQVSQVGYHPGQSKIAVIELDNNDVRTIQPELLRIDESGSPVPILKTSGKVWGNFLRYRYLQFDFTKVKAPGMYVVRYGDVQTNPFQISNTVYDRDVWQPTLEYFLPVQMCHMRVNDKYRVWHGLCHMDDARMAPTDSNHFDGYIQGPSTLNKYKPGEPVPFLNEGGWHDAGDFDLRVESQAETVHGLSLAYEIFKVPYDNTTIDQVNHIVEIQQPDGKPDILQQVEHGLLTIIGGYKAMGRFYRGMIEPSKRQYTILGDPSTITDNIVFHDSANSKRAPELGLPGSPDDRWVFTEVNPSRELGVAASLAAAARVMMGFNDTLATQCLTIAKAIWDKNETAGPMQKLGLAVELLQTTNDQQYAVFLKSLESQIVDRMGNIGWLAARSVKLVNDQQYTAAITQGAKKLYEQIMEEGNKTPYGVPYKPNIWGAGWDIQNFGYKQYFLIDAFPKIFPKDYMLSAINFILGCHPGSNVASFVSGVGASSMIPGYGFNRADWSYIPGGVGSGTALIRPDFPELLRWPYLWQQGEYVLGGGTSDYLFLILAAQHMLGEQAGSSAK
ncbi:MAG: glycoside hydrolase family 9 protein [Ferruginibacter sp.]